jgi:phage terminase small subunit
LTKLDIAAAIEKARTKRAERAELTADWVVDELRKIGFANMADYLKSTTEGDPYRDFFGTDA